MTTQKGLFLLLVAFAMLPSCFIDDDENVFGCTNGSGDLITDTLNLDNFSGIDMRSPGQVFVTQGDEYSVVVETQANILNDVEVELDNDVLEIELRECAVDFTLRIYVTMPEISYLRVTTSGEITSTDTLVGEQLETKISGSGDIDLALDYTEVLGKISGSGKTFLEGTAETLDFTINASGDLRAFDLEAETVLLTISGSGDAEVFASELLDVKISGSGDVVYDGEPTQVLVDISGSGDINPR